MKKQIILAFTLLLSGLLLMAAAATDPGLPDDYWQEPSATTATAPHDWSTLEIDLHPEACAQCHAEQFNVWKSSKHAQAYSAGLVGQFPDMGHANANDCLICHAPLKEQLYTDPKVMDASIALRLKHAEGFDSDANMDATSTLPLRHSGVSCAVCHVRGWKRFGPPLKTTASLGQQNTPAHGGFTATKAFEQSQFCASCHQFPAPMAINGKPLENTLTEWKNSSFSDQGVTCQQCHMPDRKHEFRGIHDPEMVKKGLRFSLSQSKNTASLSISSVWIGHAFPTYVTPKVIVEAEARDADQKVLQHWQWEIVREVAYNNGWQEMRDTRLMPGESRQFTATPLPSTTASLHYRVRVIPDHFYKNVYRSLLADPLTPAASAHLRQASQQAEQNDYVLYEQVLEIRTDH
ncbi:MAG: multiheme c-type cytochrome [Mariprofundus sp.]|nr:multiheme c-type cytochrome [Mariprofundus sp.]